MSSRPECLQLSPGTLVKHNIPNESLTLWKHPDHVPGAAGEWHPHETGMIVSCDRVGFNMILVLVGQKLGYVSYTYPKKLL